ncbi:LIM domain containing protein [Trichomonas vaginalis G3]|uniref:LIM domain containing protein n=1 Tax=Trichomonas vaginalis (strain ATCC PRA-98 / G3) TaxID=412133 RepID=A2FTL7_TRIV3|nr:uncharacterized protein TVAGG3_0203990 [Trichomonas vaginalis G3]EAX91751.1 LIM domain containing protein [Trichomonas vaginalis G3]KAI5550800.1 LIM domain containing protein family [Trichomonas vaginalis G3]|eukprot:XP_001304681.1 hypothetical protein [Trichomonas vaginalis G3]
MSLPPPPGGMGSKFPTQGGMSGLPPPPGGMGGLPPPPGVKGGLPPPPSSMGMGGNSMSGLPPPPMSTGFGSGRGIPPSLPTGGGMGSGLPPPPGGMGGLPPPPGGMNNSKMGGLPPPPGGMGSNFGTSGGLPPPPMSTGFNSGRGMPTTLNSGMGGGFPPAPGAGGLPPPPGGMTGGLPPPPMSRFNSGRGINTSQSMVMTGGLPPPPMTGGLPPPPGIQSNNQFNSGRGIAPSASMGFTGGLPPDPNFNSGQFNSNQLSTMNSNQFTPHTLMSMSTLGSGIPLSSHFRSAVPPVTQSSIIGFQTGPLSPAPSPMSISAESSTRYNPQQEYNDTPESSLLKTCKVCSKMCKDKYFFMFGNCYCPECLKCTRCQKSLRPPECVMYKEQPICFGCAKINGKLNRCPVCSEFLDNEEDIVSLKDLNITIHKDCLRCYECGKKLNVDEYQTIKDQICCKRCKKKATRHSCKRCEQPILGRYVFNRSHYFHVECFTCEDCSRRLNGNNFVVHHNRYYCPEQGIKYLKTCAYCKNEIQLTDITRIRWMNKYYHKRCFCCRICGVVLDPNDAKCCHNRPHCKRCYEQRVKDGDITRDGRTPSDQNHRHRPDISAAQRERFRKKFGDENWNPPRYASQQEKKESSESSSSSSSSSSDHKRKSKHSSHSGHGSHRGHESHNSRRGRH